jgi:hypothetical protein
MNEHLIEAVLWAAVFFETSDDAECDPDLAVKQLEQIAHALRELSPEEQEQFRAFARRTAERDHRAEMTTLVPALVDRLLGECDQQSRSASGSTATPSGRSCPSRPSLTPTRRARQRTA